MIRILAIFVGALLLFQGWVLCQTAGESSEAEASASDNSESRLPADLYEVSPQDVLTVTVVNELELTGDFEVSNDGTIKYPYLDYVPVASKTVKEIEKDITGLLKDGWLVDPQVIVRVKEYSPKMVFVMGEGVNRPGHYSFSGQNKMTVYRAITMAGGFNRIAKKSKVVLMTTDEEGKPARMIVDVSDIIRGKAPDPLIRANDRIYVGERWF